MSFKLRNKYLNVSFFIRVFGYELVRTDLKLFFMQKNS